jgi:hypothetical protein
MRTALVAALLVFALTTVAPVTGRWQQKQFLISFWVDPIVPPSELPAQYQTIAEANFTAVLGGFGATTPTAVQAQAAACAGAGLDCLPTTCEGLAGPWATNSSCVGVAAAPVMGYQIIDEPAQADFPQLAAWAKSIASRAPDAMRFINLLPNYGFATEAEYVAYVTAYIAQVQPDMLCFDHYPNFYAGSDSSASDVSEDGYRRNLALIRTTALAAGIPFFNFFASMPFNGRNDITEAQLRWQVFTSLTYGATGVLYFCYWSPAGSSFTWGNAIMTPQTLPGHATPVYHRGPHYEQARRVNSALLVAGTFLLNRTSTGVQHASGGPTAVVQLAAPSAFPCVGNLSGTGQQYGLSVLAGGFSGRAIVLHNQQWAYPQMVAVGLRGPWASLQELDLATGKSRPVANDAPGYTSAPDVLTLYLEAGSIRVFHC